MDIEQRKGRGDEIICSARYSLGRVSLWIIGHFLVVYLCFGLAHDSFLKENHIGAFVMFAIGLLLLLFVLEQIFSERIIFYGDRVTKVWHVFGSRTIYYSNAKATGPGKGTYWIRETGLNRQYAFTKIPIVCRPYLCSSDVSKEVRAILDRLTDSRIKALTDKNLRLIKILIISYFTLLFGVGLFLVWNLT